MPNVSSPAALPKVIEQLLSQHKQHSDALAAIESTLSRVTAALGVALPGPVLGTAPKKRGRPFKNPAAALSTPALSKAAPKRARRAKGGITANDFVLAFVEAKENPSTQEINNHWKESGRLGTADNSLSLLTKAKKLKRIKPTDGTRGSRYSIA